MTRQQIAAARQALTAYYAGSVSQSVQDSTPVVIHCPASRLPGDDTRRQELLAARKEVQATIDAAYWRFTRQARALPPSLQCPEAYSRRAAIDMALALL